jgi:transcriptional regulator with XRE-family HTH domain
MSTLLPPPADVLGESQQSVEQIQLAQPEPAVTSAANYAFADFGGAPRLSILGKRIEMLRVDRGLSKQALAKSSGTSRQQLWRVMTGKADLTPPLSQRLATVLDVDSRTLSTATLGHGDVEVPLTGAAAWPTAPGSLGAFLESPAMVTRSLRSLPAGEDGVALRTALLNAIEERARARGLRLPDWLLQLRGSVLNGEL